LGAYYLKNNGQVLKQVLDVSGIWKERIDKILLLNAPPSIEADLHYCFQLGLFDSPSPKHVVQVKKEEELKILKLYMSVNIIPRDYGGKGEPRWPPNFNNSVKLANIADVQFLKMKCNTKPFFQNMFDYRAYASIHVGSKAEVLKLFKPLLPEIKIHLQFEVKGNIKSNGILNYFGEEFLKLETESRQKKQRTSRSPFRTTIRSRKRITPTNIRTKEIKHQSSSIFSFFGCVNSR